MTEDISDEMDEIEQALVTVQTYIRRYYALKKYNYLRIYFLSLTHHIRVRIDIFIHFLSV
jgi:hypothetical protein